MWTLISVSSAALLRRLHVSWLAMRFFFSSHAHVRVVMSMFRSRTRFSTLTAAGSLPRSRRKSIPSASRSPGLRWLSRSCKELCLNSQSLSTWSLSPQIGRGSSGTLFLGKVIDRNSSLVLQPPAATSSNAARLNRSSRSSVTRLSPFAGSADHAPAHGSARDPYRDLQEYRRDRAQASCFGGAMSARSPVLE